MLLPTGAGEARKIAFEGFDNYRRAVFLPDGRELLFVSKKGQEPIRFYRGSIEGGKARAVTPPAQGPFALSPDGRRLVAMGPQRSAVIFTLEAGPDAPGRPVPGAGAGDLPVQWSADGRSIYMRRAAGEADKKVRIFRVDPESGRWEPWKEIVPAEAAGFSIGGSFYMTPDGKSYAYGIARELSQLYFVEGLK